MEQSVEQLVFYAVAAGVVLLGGLFLFWLVHSRDKIQQQARNELKAKFEQFDIQCVDVLIGKPESKSDDGKIENLLEQLRLRQLSLEQIETYVVTAKADSESISLEGKGQSDKISLVGTSEADVLRKKVESFGDGKLYALSLVADALSHKGLGDLVCRLKSPERVDEIVRLLLQYKQEVWPKPATDGQHRHSSLN